MARGAGKYKERQMSTVTFGKRDRLRFQSVGTLPSWQAQVVPAIYAITYKQNAENRPKAHTVLYFGEADDLSKHAPAINKDVGTWWNERGGNTSELFVFIYPMPGSSQFERVNIQHQLVAEYDPQANQ
jgi:hypothetical protein